MNTREKIEVFSAGCEACKKTVEMVQRIAGSSYDVVVNDMHDAKVASRAAQLGIRSVPAVVVSGRLAACCAERGVDEPVLRRSLGMA